MIVCNAVLTSLSLSRRSLDDVGGVVDKDKQQEEEEEEEEDEVDLTAPNSSLNDTTDTIRGLSTTLQKAASSVADISQLPTTQYGLGPITPPDGLGSDSIYTAVNEIESNLDGALKR